MTSSLTSQVLDVTARLSPTDRDVLELVGRFRFCSGRQLERLAYPGEPSPSRARIARRALQRLTELGTLVRLDRRIGGVRAGSAGYVYALSPLGVRVIEFLAGAGVVRGRGTHDPGSTFVRHILAVTETFVRLTEASLSGLVELISFDPEPGCWRRFVGAGGARLVLKPDASVQLGIGAYLDNYFFEVDCGTEGRGALLAKFQAYVSYYRSGREQQERGIFPRVLWVVPTAARAAVLERVVVELRPEARQLFAVVRFGELVASLASADGVAS
jgi:hypothetical protein